MALSADAIKAAYPLPSYNYKVTAGSDTLSFSEVSGLSLEYEKVIYKHGFSFLMGANIIRGQHNPISVTLKRGVVAKRNHLYNWLSDQSKKDILIDLCDEKGNPIVRWKLTRAMPLKMDAPSFNASGTEIAFESVELIAHDLQIEYL